MFNLNLNLLKTSSHPRLIVMRIGPVPMKFDYVRMLELCEALEDDLDLLLLRLKVLAFGELHLIPHHLDTLLGVHGQVGAIDARHVALLHLGRDFKYIYNRDKYNAYI